MKLLETLKKGAFIAPFLLFSACTTPCPKWEYTQINTSCASFNSSKIFISPENEGTGLELEISRSPTEGERFYINIFSLEPFPFAKSKVPVRITIDDTTNEVLVDRFLGGQRFLLPSEIYGPIINALNDNRVVTIILGRYRSDIIALGFPKAYNELGKP